MKNKELIEKMTLEEKAALLSGKGEWQTWNFDRLGIPSMYCSDGPHGIRRQAGAGDHLGLNPSLPATCFPTAATMANSWDPELGEEIGQALGEEAKVQGVHVVLGPGLNIKRSREVRFAEGTLNIFLRTRTCPARWRRGISGGSRAWEDTPVRSTSR